MRVWVRRGGGMGEVGFRVREMARIVIVVEQGGWGYCKGG